jgi:geranyl-CoA carboxylase alpha subunit
MGRVTDTKCYEANGVPQDVTLIPLRIGEYEVSVGEETHLVTVSEMGENDLSAEVDGLMQRYHYVSEAPASLYLASSDRSALLADSTRIPPEAEDAAGGGTIAAPMHGQLLSIDVETGASVCKGQRIAVLEAMKMQHELTAPGDGTVVDIAAVAGKQIGAGDLIMVLELAGLESEE